MDIDDVKNRLNLISLSIKKSKEFDLKPKSVRKIFPYRVNNNFEMTVCFGTKTKEEMIFDIFTIVLYLGNLRDIIKKQLKNKGLERKIMEERINKSKYLQVLIDLYNEHKHGFPLKDGYRSGGQPIIEEIKQGMIIPPGETVEFILHYDTGEVEVDKLFPIGISAKIMDRSGFEYFELDELIENVVKEYENIIEEFRLTTAST